MIAVRPVVHAISRLAIVMAGLMLLPAALDLGRDDPAWRAFAAVAAGTALIAGLVALATRSAATATGEAPELTVEQAFLMTAGLWLVLPAISALPFMLASPQASLTDALFEAMSGMSTTGATVFPRLDDLDMGTHLWRALLQWSGGLGIVVVAMVFMPVMRVGGMQFFRSEGFDTMGKVMPRAGSIAGELTQVYVGLTLACVLAFRATGMPALDSVIHALTSCSTGGFSSRDASFGSYLGAPQVVATVFMVLASIPFARMVQAKNGAPQALWQDSQIRAFAATIAGLTATILAYRVLWLGGAFSVEMLRETLFNVVTIQTGTGYASQDVTQWGHLSFVLLILAGLIGGCTGSTGCSIKVFRWQVLMRALGAQIALMQSPHRVVPLRLGGRRLDGEVINSVMALFTMFMLTFGVLIVALALTGLHPRTALTAAWTSIANVGPVWGPEVTMNGSVADFPAAAKWLMIAGMYLGRLEVITVLVVLTPRFWRGQGVRG